MRSIAPPRRPTTGMLAVLALVALAFSGLAASPERADGPGGGRPLGREHGRFVHRGEAGRWAGNTNRSSATIDDLGPTAYFDSPGRTAEPIARCHRSQAAEVFIGGGVSDDSTHVTASRYAVDGGLTRR
jgi:hypothetical protein